MADLYDNPMGLDGFEFVEYAASERGILEPVFEVMGFSHIASHRSKDVDLWRQGGINFVVNYEKNSPAAYYAEEHGPSACGMAFRVKDATKAYTRALELGAQPIDIPAGPMELKLRKTGNSLATTWPKEILNRLNVKEGDKLYAVETLHGVLITPYDPKFEKAMDVAKRVMARDRDALKELAK